MTLVKKINFLILNSIFRGLIYKSEYFYHHTRQSWLCRTSNSLRSFKHEYESRSTMLVKDCISVLVKFRINLWKCK